MNTQNSIAASLSSTLHLHPFGMQMPGRSYTISSPFGGGQEGAYRFGFNGMEKDDEMKGSGNSLDFGARIYDSRLGVFLSIDPRTDEFAYWSPYIYAADNPITFVDENGEGPLLALLKLIGGSSKITKTVNSVSINIEAKAGMGWITSGGSVGIGLAADPNGGYAFLTTKSAFANLLSIGTNKGGMMDGKNMYIGGTTGIGLTGSTFKFDKVTQLEGNMNNTDLDFGAVSATFAKNDYGQLEGGSLTASFGWGAGMGNRDELSNVFAMNDKDVATLEANVFKAYNKFNGQKKELIKKGLATNYFVKSEENCNGDINFYVEIVSSQIGTGYKETSRVDLINFKKKSENIYEAENYKSENR